MIPSEKIQLFATHQLNYKVNPEQAATRQLLQISDEDYSYDPLIVTNNLEPPPKLQKYRSSYSQRNNKMFRPQSNYKAQIPSYLVKTHNNFNKESTRYLSGEEVCVMKKEKILNLSNFLIIDNESSPDLLTTIPKQQFQEENKGSSRARIPKNIVAFIRRRNLSYLKQQVSEQLQNKKNQNNQKRGKPRNYSPLMKINASCELRKSGEQFNETKPFHIFQRPSNASPQMNCTSPNFRNRKMSNYMKYRLCLGKVEKDLYL